MPPSKNRTDVIIGKILVAVDGSKPSLDAAEEAIDLAEMFAANLFVLYVIPRDIRYGYTGDSITSEFVGSLKEIVIIAMEKGRKYVDGKN